MTVREAADQLGLSVRLVQKLCQLRKIRHLRISTGGRRSLIQILPEHIAEFRSTCEVAPSDAPEMSAPCRARRPRGLVIPDYVPLKDRKPVT